MIGSIENEIIENIKSINELDALGYKIRQIKTYGGELATRKDRAKIKDFPAVWIANDGANPAQIMNANTMYKGVFVALCATRNLRNEQAARHGVAGDVGVYQLAIDIAGILGGLRFENLDKVGKLELSSIKPVSVDDSENGRIAVYAVNFMVNFNVDHITPSIDKTNPLKIIHTNWDLPPNGGVGPDLPDDENADATSHLTGE